MGSTKIKGLEKKKEEEKIEKIKKHKEKEVRVEKAIVRIIGTDVDGTLPIRRAIWKIKGVGFSFGNAVCKVLTMQFNWNINDPIGNLTDENLALLEDIIRNPAKYKIPHWMFNRRKDIEDGKDYHLVGNDLTMKIEFDIKREIELRTYRGWRHMLGQPVRGQRTRSHFRKGRAVGVSRKKK